MHKTLILITLILVLTIATSTQAQTPKFQNPRLAPLLQKLKARRALEVQPTTRHRDLIVPIEFTHSLERSIRIAQHTAVDFSRTRGGNRKVRQRNTAIGIGAAILYIIFRDRGGSGGSNPDNPEIPGGGSGT